MKNDIQGPSLASRVREGDLTVVEAAKLLKSVTESGDTRTEIAIRAFLYLESPAQARQLSTLVRLCDKIGDRAPAREVALRVDDGRDFTARELRELTPLWMEAGAHERAAGFAHQLMEAAPDDASVLGLAVRALAASGREDEARRLSDDYFNRWRSPRSDIYAEHAPHMAEYYDSSRSAPTLPFLSAAPPALHDKASLSTDVRGYRYTVDKSGRRFAPYDDPEKIGDAALFGGSTAFGCGASADAQSLASRLSDEKLHFYNFARPAYVLQLSTIQLLFELPALAQIKRAVLLIGVNELVSYALSPIIARGLGSFFTWNAQCLREMPFLSHLPPDYWPASARSVFLTHDPAAGVVPEGVREEMMEPLERMLFAWRMLSERMGFSLCLVLQPSTLWLERTPPREERELFAKYETAHELTQDVAARSFATRNGAWFAAALRRAAEEQGLEFFDANMAFQASSRRDESLFVDYCHLNDMGQALLADMIPRERGEDRSADTLSWEPPRRAFSDRLAKLAGRFRKSTGAQPIPLPKDNYPLW